MAYAKIEPSGCGIHKGRVKLRIDFFMNPDDPNYDKTHALIVDEASVEFKRGYNGEVDAKGHLLDFADYKRWLGGLPHIWRDNPFHHHFIYPDKEDTDADITANIEACLDYFYTFHQQMWATDKKFINEWKKVPKIKGSIRDVSGKGMPKDLTAHETKIANILTRVAEFQVGKSIVPLTDLKIGDKGTIDIGAAASNRSGYWDPGTTIVALDNPANASGTIDTFEIYPNTASMLNTKAGTFYGAGTSYTCRDYETIGTVTVGAPDPDIFTGLDIDVETGDFAGTYYSGGYIEWDNNGFAGIYWKSGDQFTAGAQTYAISASDAISLYGTGVEAIAHTKALADTVAIADAIIKAVGQPQADIMAIADSPAFVAAFARALADTVAITDSLADVVDFILTISDTVALADSIVKDIGLAKSDSVAIADALIKAIGQPQADSIAIADVMVKGMGLAEADSVTIADSFATLLEYVLNLADSVSIIDNIAKAVAVTKADSVALADEISLTYGMSLSDAIAIVATAKLAYPVRAALAIGRMPFTHMHDPEV